MSNKRDHISDCFEVKAVSRGEFEAKGVGRGEFEALKRFGDYEQLKDGTLMRMEGNKEFRIYREDSGWLLGRLNGGPAVIVTPGYCRMLGEAADRLAEKEKKDPGYRKRKWKEFKIWLSQQPTASTTASSSVLPASANRQITDGKSSLQLAGESSPSATPGAALEENTVTAAEYARYGLEGATSP